MPQLFAQFYTEWYFFVIMGLLLAALIGVLYYLRSRPED